MAFFKHSIEIEYLYVIFPVMCYLIIFAHEDLGLDCFGNIVISLGFKKMQTVRNASFD